MNGPEASRLARSLAAAGRAAGSCWLLAPWAIPAVLAHEDLLGAAHDEVVEAGQRRVDLVGGGTLIVPRATSWSHTRSLDVVEKSTWPSSSKAPSAPAGSSVPAGRPWVPGTSAATGRAGSISTQQTSPGPFGSVAASSC